MLIIIIKKVFPVKAPLLLFISAAYIFCTSIKGNEKKFAYSAQRYCLSPFLISPSLNKKIKNTETHSFFISQLVQRLPGLDPCRFIQDLFRDELIKADCDVSDESHPNFSDCSVWLRGALDPAPPRGLR